MSRPDTPDHRWGPLRISLIAPCWFPVPPLGYGGIERVVALLADGLVDRGHDVTLFAAPGSQTKARLIAPLDEVPDPADLGDAWYETRHALTALTHDVPADVIHDHSGPVGAALAAALGKRAPVVHTLHGPWTEASRGLYGLLHQSLHLVAISQSQRQLNPSLRYAGVVPNGIDVDATAFSAEKDDHLVFVGRANPQKNPSGAIRIARLVQRPITMFVKCNEPDEHTYWDECVKPLLGSDVTVMHGASEGERGAVVARAHAKVFPIRWDEPFGLVMAEAMAAGTPVLATPRGAAPELVVEGRTGFLRRSEEELAAAVDDAGSISPSTCRDHVRRLYSAEAMVVGYERLYRDVIARTCAQFDSTSM